MRRIHELGMDLTGVRADSPESPNGAADEREEQVVAEGEAGTDGDGAAAEQPKEAEEAKVED